MIIDFMLLYLPSKLSSLETGSNFAFVVFFKKRTINVEKNLPYQGLFTDMRKIWHELTNNTNFALTVP